MISELECEKKITATYAKCLEEIVALSRRNMVLWVENEALKERFEAARYVAIKNKKYFEAQVTESDIRMLWGPEDDAQAFVDREIEERLKERKQT